MPDPARKAKVAPPSLVPAAFTQEDYRRMLRRLLNLQNFVAIKATYTASAANKLLGRMPNYAR